MTGAHHPHTLSIAPMMDYTDRHFRYLARLMSPHIWLYTEMITTSALLHGEATKLLAFNAEEHPLALQLGGSEPAALAHCAQLATEHGYDHINLNVGCPSAKVQHACFGAALMKQPNLVADCVAAMRQKTDLPITVKTRLGVDQQDSYPRLKQFIHTVAQSGCQLFIIHARKAWLQGLNPKQNRHIPPLRYDWVYQLKTDFPTLQIIINGGIDTIEAIQQHLTQVDGVMIGRKAYHDPYWIQALESNFFQQASSIKPQTIIMNYLHYMERQLTRGVPFHQLAKHLLGFFKGIVGAKTWRRSITQLCQHKNHTDQLALLEQTLMTQLG